MLNGGIGQVNPARKVPCDLEPDYLGSPDPGGPPTPGRTLHFQRIPTILAPHSGGLGIIPSPYGGWVSVGPGEEAGALPRTSGRGGFDLSQSGRRYLLTGGGTGGHVTPNIALIGEIRRRDETAQFL